MKFLLCACTCRAALVGQELVLFFIIANQRIMLFDKALGLLLRAAAHHQSRSALESAIDHSIVGLHYRDSRKEFGTFLGQCSHGPAKAVHAR